MTGAAIDALVTKPHDLRERPQRIVVVDARRIDELDTHGARDLALELEEASARCASDRVVEDQRARAFARGAASARPDLDQGAVKQDRARELLATAAARDFGDLHGLAAERRIG